MGIERKRLVEQEQYQAQKGQEAARVQQDRLALQNTTIEQDSVLIRNKTEATERAVSRPNSKPNVCELNPGKFKGCSVF